jgi:glucose dehydrogenase
MTATAKAALHRRNTARRHRERAVRTALGISGVLFALLGAVLAVGGLLSANGSVFAVLVGLGLIVSGALVARRQRAGAWTYMVVFAATLSWSMRNVDTGSPLPLRLIGPFLLLVMIAALMPLLGGWRPRHAATVLTLLVGATLAIGISSLPGHPLARPTAAATQFLDDETKGILQ